MHSWLLVLFCFVFFKCKNQYQRIEEGARRDKEYDVGWFQTMNKKEIVNHKAEF